MQTASTADLIRPAARLLADVTDFMTLRRETCFAWAPRDPRRA